MDYPQIDSILGKDSPYLIEIEKMRNSILSIPLDRFYEPVSVIDASHKKRKIIGLSPELVHAWVKRVSYSSRIRMINLELGALSELDALRVLTAMILVRSHVEASGFACLCHNELKKCIETGDRSGVEELIPQMLLGTSMVRAQKKDESIAETLLLSEQDKVPIGRLISAFDEFLSCGDTNGHAHTLCNTIFQLLVFCACFSCSDVRKSQFRRRRFSPSLPTKYFKEPLFYRANSITFWLRPRAAPRVYSS